MGEEYSTKIFLLSVVCQDGLHNGVKCENKKNQLDVHVKSIQESINALLYPLRRDKVWHMVIPSISNETSPLQCVLLGVADQSGPTPKYEEAYDPKSRLHISKGTYPNERDLIRQLDLIQAILEKHGVEVLRPHIVSNCNQIFSRDIAFVIEDCLYIKHSRSRQRN